MQMVDDNVGNQVRQNAVQNDGNEYGMEILLQAPDEVLVCINGNTIRFTNCRGEGLMPVKCHSKAKKTGCGLSSVTDALICSRGRSCGSNATSEEYEFMAAADDYEMDQLSSDTLCASNTLDPVSQKLKDKNVPLEFQTKSIIDSLQKQLYDTIYENAKLRAQLFDKVYKPKGTTKGTRMNTMFTKQSILGKPPSSSSGSKLYSVTPFLKSSVLPKVDKTNALSKPVTSNSAPSTRELKVVQTENQKKHKANAKKSKELGSKGSLASSRPSKPRACLSTSNPSEPSSKGFPISTSLIGMLSRLRKQHTFIYAILVL
ncbi:hypothetical protein Tco_0608257 [Tanacetum coccineum]